MSSSVVIIITSLLLSTSSIHLSLPLTSLPYRSFTHTDLPAIPSVHHKLILFVLISQLRSTSGLDVPLVIPPSPHFSYPCDLTSSLATNFPEPVGNLSDQVNFPGQPL